MSSQLSGFVDSLSGRVDTIESRISEVLQKLLLRVDLTTLSNFKNIVTTQLDTFGAAQDTHETRIDTVEGLYQNLAFDFLSHVADFTGHTGDSSLHN